MSTPTFIPSGTPTLNRHNYKSYEEVYTIVGYIACFSSFSIVLTSILFKSMFQKKTLMQLVLAMAGSDCLANIFTVLGFPGKGAECAIQGAFFQFFFRMSMTYTCFLSHSLYSICKYGDLYFSLNMIHGITWTINIALELLPLSTTSYGAGFESSKQKYI